MHTLPLNLLVSLGAGDAFWCGSAKVQACVDRLTLRLSRRERVGV